MSWKEARSLAHRLGGDLVAAENRAEAAWIRDKFLLNGDSRVPLWMGASVKPGSRDWRWVRGDEVPDGFFREALALSEPLGMLLVPDNAGLNLSSESIRERHSFVIKWQDPGASKVAMW